MNLPNKITLARIIMAALIIIIILFPFHTVGITGTKLFINEAIVVDIRYLIAGVLFFIASFTDLIDGYIARKYNLVTDAGKILDAIADKVLVNAVLVALAARGMIHPLIPIIVISRDVIVDSIKMIAGSKKEVVAASKLGKVKTAFMMSGITLSLFYNLPFELWNLNVSNLLLIFAVILSVMSAFDYYYKYKEVI